MALLGCTWSDYSICNQQGSKYMKKVTKLTNATYGEWQASLWGACAIAFGLGVLFAGYFEGISLILLAIGIPLHSWGMYKIHQRNKER